MTTGPPCSPANLGHDVSALHLSAKVCHGHGQLCEYALLQGHWDALDSAVCGGFGPAFLAFVHADLSDELDLLIFMVRPITSRQRLQEQHR